jgi:hypothetical protein
MGPVIVLCAVVMQTSQVTPLTSSSLPYSDRDQDLEHIRARVVAS